MSQAAVKHQDDVSTDLSAAYLSVVGLIERLHRQLLDVIKDGLERNGIREVSSVQALLLYNIGDQELTAGELKRRGHYLGSNVSYNIKQLAEMGLLDQDRSDGDRRTSIISLTRAGREIAAMVQATFDKQGNMLGAVYGFSAQDLEGLAGPLIKLERFWGDQIRYQL